MNALTRREKLLVICALHAVAPTGGGSDEFTLAGKLAEMWDLNPADLIVGRMQTTAYLEYTEHHEEQLTSTL